MYLAPGRDRTCGLTTGIKNAFAFVMLGDVCSCKNARLDISPRAIVKGFLLKGSDKSNKWMEDVARGITWHHRISALGYASR